MCVEGDGDKKTLKGSRRKERELREAAIRKLRITEIKETK